MTYLHQVLEVAFPGLDRSAVLIELISVLVHLLFLGSLLDQEPQHMIANWLARQRHRRMKDNKL